MQTQSNQKYLFYGVGVDERGDFFPTINGTPIEILHTDGPRVITYIDFFAALRMARQSAFDTRVQYKQKGEHLPTPMEECFRESPELYASPRHFERFDQWANVIRNWSKEFKQHLKESTNDTTQSKGS